MGVALQTCIPNEEAGVRTSVNVHLTLRSATCACVCNYVKSVGERETERERREE